MKSDVILATALLLTAACSAPERLEDEVRRLRDENARLRVELEALRALVADVDPVEPTERASTADPMPVSPTTERVRIERDVALRTAYDDATKTTTVSTAFVRFEAQSLLAPKLWMRLRYAIAVGAPIDSVEHVTMVFATERSQGRFAGTREVTFRVDGTTIPCAVASYDADRRPVTRGRQRRVDQDETLEVAIPVTLLPALTRASALRCGRETLRLSPEQQALFAAVDARLAAPGSAGE